MTKAQQDAGKKLRAAQEEYLRAYGWEQQGARWQHRRRAALGSIDTHDAFMETRADPKLGWP